MITKKSQLKSVIKQIVRESINEKCGGGHLAGGDTGKRMFQHIKTGYRGKKSPEDAASIAAATVNKKLDEAGLTSEAGENIPKGKLAQLNPKIVNKGEKIRKVTPLPPLPPKKVNEGGPQYKVVSPTQARCSKCNQALNMQYDPKMTEAKEEEEDEGYEGYTPGKKSRPSKPDPNEKDMGPNRKSPSDGEMEDRKVDKAIGKMQDDPTYRPPPFDKVEEAGNPLADKIQTIVKLVEKAIEFIDQNPDEAKALLEKLAGVLKGTGATMDENHKVQARSFKTVNDLSNDPNNVRDPEVPLT